MFFNQYHQKRQNGIRKTFFWTGGGNLYVGLIRAHIPIGEKQQAEQQQ